MARKTSHAVTAYVSARFKRQVAHEARRRGMPVSKFARLLIKHAWNDLAARSAPGNASGGTEALLEKDITSRAPRAKKGPVRDVTIRPDRRRKE